MKRKTFKKRIEDYPFDNVPLFDFVDGLQNLYNELLLQGAKNIQVIHHCYYDSGQMDILYELQETDEQMNARIQKQEDEKTEKRRKKMAKLRADAEALGVSICETDENMQKQ